jgi:hypothetical protein
VFNNGRAASDAKKPCNNFRARSSKRTKTLDWAAARRMISSTAATTALRQALTAASAAWRQHFRPLDPQTQSVRFPPVSMKHAAFVGVRSIFLPGSSGEKPTVVVMVTSHEMGDAKSSPAIPKPVRTSKQSAEQRAMLRMNAADCVGRDIRSVARRPAVTLGRQPG